MMRTVKGTTLQYQHAMSCWVDGIGEVYCHFQTGSEVHKENIMAFQDDRKGYVFAWGLENDCHLHC